MPQKGALDAFVARQVLFFKYRGYRHCSSACCNASAMACSALATSSKVQPPLLVLYCGSVCS